MTKPLLASQRELIRIKQAQAQAVAADLQATINSIAIELGINPDENWRLTPDLAAFEKPETKE